MGKFIITKRLNGEFQFNLKSNNGLVILTSEGYTTKENCENGIQSVKRYSQDDVLFQKCKSVNNKYYFTLKAGNGQIIGTSQLYGSDFATEKGIASVKNNAVEAATEDKTSKRILQYAN
ncbi:YegP family protein [Flavobacterium paronense]|uniref:YegP family protein n=1 Tax=Flavobacterium paronense TaxID=1392775 RepID=A0ABV5GBI8_9FLAO|nr:YegP family protein [Flavobacterium paronense]MDN3677688.1 YegP family protein [Flavobacterium paronense]